MALDHVPCEVCGSQSTTQLYLKFGAPIAQCNRCRLIFANPRLSKAEIMMRYSPEYFWQEYLPSLGVHDGQFSLDYFDARYAVMLRLIAEHIPPPGKMLEIGTGAGFFLKAAQRLGWDVDGIEVSASAVEFANSRLGLRVNHQEAEELSYPEKSFDVVVMFEVIEHLFWPSRVLDAIHQVLRPGGLLVISTPNYNALSHWALGLSWAVLSPAEHLYYFEEQSLQRMLEKSSFCNTKILRKYPGFGLFETMNPNYTHAPRSPRKAIYKAFVTTAGRFLFRYIQAKGLGDTLLCLSNVC